MDGYITRRGSGGGFNVRVKAYHSVDEFPVKVRENTIGVITDEPIVGFDFSMEEPFRKSANKNLITSPFCETTHAYSGITWIDNGDGTITVNGTSPSGAINVFLLTPRFGATSHGNSIYLESGLYTLSGSPGGGCHIRLYKRTASHESLVCSDDGYGTVFELTEATEIRCELYITPGATIANAVFKPQLEKGLSATAFIMGRVANGRVWIQTGTRDYDAFFASTKNRIEIRPHHCYQDIDGEWVEKSAYSYKNGSWVKWWEGELFTLNNQWLNVTGGWGGSQIEATSATSKTGVSTKARENPNGGIYMDVLTESIGETTSTAFRIKKRIDLTDFSILTFEGYFERPGSNANNLVAACWEDITQLDYYTQKMAAFSKLSKTTATTISVDISKLTGLHHIGIGMRNAYARIDRCVLT